MNHQILLSVQIPGAAAAEGSTQWVFWIAIIIGIAGLFVLLVPVLRGLWMRYSLWRQRRKAVREARKDIFLRSRLAEVARGGREGEEAEPDVLRRRIAELKQDFAEGTAALTTTGTDARQRPWFLLIGNPGSGRSTMMKASDLDLLDPGTGADTTKNARLNWWFHPNGTVLDPSGEVLAPNWGNRGAAEYRELLRMIEHDRNAPELQGIIITIEASVLLGPEEAIEREMDRLKGLLVDTGRGLGLELPVYLVVTKSDQIDGMPSLLDSIGESRRVRQMLGWSAEEQGLLRFNEDDLRRGMLELKSRIAFIARSLMSRRDLMLGGTESLFRRSADLYNLPNRMQEIGERLAIIGSSLFGEAAALHNGHLRGIYFTSVGTAVDGSDQRTNGRFIRDIFVEKIFRERMLGGVSRSRFRKVLISMFGSLGALYLILAMYLYGTLNSSTELEAESRAINSTWSSVMSRLNEGRLFESPIIGKDSEGRYELNSSLNLAGEQVSRIDFLRGLATQSYRIIEVPAAFRLSGPGMGTIENNLLDKQRRLAYRAAFNPMVVNPLVNSVIDLMTNGEEAWTNDATRAFMGLLQIEQAAANIHEDWRHTFEVGDLNTSTLVGYVLQNASSAQQEYAERAGIRSQAGFTTQVGANHILSAVSYEAMIESLVAANAGTVQMKAALERGRLRYEKAWTTLDYRSHFALGQAEIAIQALKDFLAAQKDLEDLSMAIEVYKAFPPTERQAAAMTRSWNTAYEQAAGAMKAWQLSSQRLGFEAGTDLEPFVKKAIAANQTQVDAEFDQILARTSLIGRARETLEGDLIDVTRAEMVNLQTKVQRGLFQIGVDLLATAVDLDKKIWVSPAPANTSANGAKTASKPEPVLVPTIVMPVLEDIHARMQSGPVGSADDFRVEIASESADGVRLYDRVSTGLKPLAQDKNYAGLIPASQWIAELANWNVSYRSIAAGIDSLPRSSSEIGDQVAATADGSNPWFRPGIPLTTSPDSGSFLDRYNPTQAAQVILPWQSVRDQIDSVIASIKSGAGAAGNGTGPEGSGPPSIMMVGQRDLNRQYRERAASLNGYLSEYFDYWSRAADQAGDIDVGIPWPDFVQSLSSVEPFQINNALLAYLQSVRLALDVGFLANDPAIGQAAKSRSTAIQTEIGQLTPITNAGLNSTLANWRRLSPTMSLARMDLLNLTVDQFEKSFTFVQPSGAAEVIGYWKNMASSGVGLLATSVSVGAETTMQRVNRSANRWPLLNGSLREPALTQKEVDDYAGAVGRFMVGPLNATTGSETTPGTTGSEIPDPKNTTLLAGGVTGDPTLDYEFRRLRNGLLSVIDQPGAASAPVLSPSERVGNVIMALSGRTAPLAGFLVQPPIEKLLQIPDMPTRQKAPVSAANQFRYLEVWVDGTMTGTRAETMRGDGVQRVVDAIRIPADCDTLELRFYRGMDSKEAGATASWSSSWALIAAYLQDQTSSDQKTGIAWIPVIFTNDVELECYWWFGVKFDRPLPAPASWPTPRDWPVDPGASKDESGTSATSGATAGEPATTDASSDQSDQNPDAEAAPKEAADAEPQETGS